VTQRGLTAHLFASMLLAPLILILDEPVQLVILAAMDVVLLGVFAWQLAAQGNGNLLSPTLWSMIGYVAFGQLAMVVAWVAGDMADWGFSKAALTLMAQLILAGYRVMVGAALLTRPWRGRTASAQVPSLRISVGLVLAVFGGLARIFVANNATTVEVDWAWYYAFWLTCAPAGVALGLGTSSDVLRSRSGMERAARWLIAGIGVACALVDVSRKDTGSLLTAVAIYAVLGVRAQRFNLTLNRRRLVAFGATLAVFWVLLMSTRTYSWVRESGSAFGQEFDKSIRERRGNDLLQPLAFVIETTPQIFGYLNGYTLGSLVPLPRALLPRRPPAHSYIVGLQLRGIDETHFYPEYMGANQLSVSAHMLGEGYTNFGVLGALGFEFVFGLLVGWYERALRNGRLVVLRVTFPIVLFFILTQQRGDLAMMNSGWLMCAGFVFGVLLLVSRDYRRCLFAKLAIHGRGGSRKWAGPAVEEARGGPHQARQFGQVSSESVKPRSGDADWQPLQKA
jgi:hypothetical protein